MYNSDENDSIQEERGRFAIPPSKTQTIVRTIFGIVMVVIYVGMGVLLLINFFNWQNDWAWTRYIVGVVLIIYGFWRAYRQYKGIDSRL